MAKRLLVVDDDPRLTAIVALTAQTLEIETMQVNDPLRALDAFIAFRPDAVMIDLFMPEKDGIDVLNEILLTGISTQVVLTSGSGNELIPLAEESLRFHGVHDAAVLAKPFRRGDLVAVLTTLVA
jgi:CheY-like chemotaxis protein